MSSVFSKLANIISDIADIDLNDINEDSSFMDDLDLSSLEIMSIIARIEKEFSIKVEEKELLSVAIVDDAVKIIAAKQKEL
ncbi:acyl carrier protein [Butyrivibrio sp. AC2005]|uniref:acyl carrier protein n=1 Tax=Butyrivibrio sp. AC2005 TaxID=1280672 RepID=UPI00041F2890|nr:acyl carrier protein [Butyrivibrio sp. AC2005]